MRQLNRHEASCGHQYNTFKSYVHCLAPSVAVKCTPDYVYQRRMLPTVPAEPERMESPWVVITPLATRGLASGMGLANGTRIQNSSLDNVEIVDGVVVADGTVVELAQLSDPEWACVMRQPVLVQNSHIAPGNKLVTNGVGMCKTVRRRIFDTVIVGTGNEISGSMISCRIYGSHNRFECSATRVHVKGSKNHFCMCHQVKNTGVTGDGNQFICGALNAHVRGSDNVFRERISFDSFHGNCNKPEQHAPIVID